MTLTHSANTSWADSASEDPEHVGLTGFGEQVVREQHRLGVLQVGPSGHDGAVVLFGLGLQGTDQVEHLCGDHGCGVAAQPLTSPGARMNVGVYAEGNSSGKRATRRVSSRSPTPSAILSIS